MKESHVALETPDLKESTISTHFPALDSFLFQEEFESVYKEVYVPRLWDQGKPDRPCVCLRMNWKKQKKMDAVFLLNHVT